jgi:hypothetical protein
MKIPAMRQQMAQNETVTRSNNDQSHYESLRNFCFTNNDIVYKILSFLVATKLHWGDKHNFVWDEINFKKKMSSTVIFNPVFYIDSNHLHLNLTNRNDKQQIRQQLQQWIDLAMSGAKGSLRQCFALRICHNFSKNPVGKEILNQLFESHKKYCKELSLNYITSINGLDLTYFTNLEILHLKDSIQSFADLKVIDKPNLHASLRVLNLSHNHLSALTNSTTSVAKYLSDFINLQELDLRGNNLKIADLLIDKTNLHASLRVLNLSHNHLSALTDSTPSVAEYLSDFINLQELDLRWNNLSMTDLAAIIKQPNLCKSLINLMLSIDLTKLSQSNTILEYVEYQKLQKLSLDLVGLNNLEYWSNNDLLKNLFKNNSFLCQATKITIDTYNSAHAQIYCAEILRQVETLQEISMPYYSFLGKFIITPAAENLHIKDDTVLSFGQNYQITYSELKNQQDATYFSILLFSMLNTKHPKQKIAWHRNGQTNTLFEIVPQKNNTIQVISSYQVLHSTHYKDLLFNSNSVHYKDLLTNTYSLIDTEHQQNRTAIENIMSIFTQQPIEQPTNILTIILFLSFLTLTVVALTLHPLGIMFFAAPAILLSTIILPLSLFIAISSTLSQNKKIDAMNQLYKEYIPNSFNDNEIRKLKDLLRWQNIKRCILFCYLNTCMFIISTGVPILMPSAKAIMSLLFLMTASKILIIMLALAISISIVACTALMAYYAAKAMLWLDKSFRDQALWKYNFLVDMQKSNNFFSSFRHSNHHIANLNLCKNFLTTIDNANVSINNQPSSYTPPPENMLNMLY